MADALVPSDAVKAIQDSVVTEIIKVDETEFTTRPVFDPPQPKRVETLAIATLSGLVEFVRSQGLNDEPEVIAGSGIIIQVEGLNSVAVKGPISNDRSKARDVFARATANDPFAKGFQLDEYMALSDFNIALRTLFDTGGDRDAIVAFLGNVQGNQVAEGMDDGFSQAVTVRRGVVKVGTEEVKNPVRLSPYRTFKEIFPVCSDFVLRLKGDPDNEKPPTVALFEADGGAGAQDAVIAIVAYLKQELPDEVVIG